MRSSTRACAIFACVALSFLRGSPLSPAATPDVDGSPAKLVRAALEAELTGSSQERARFLAEALAIDPNFAPARWQSGFVRIGDEWIKFDDVPKRVAGDPQLAAYRKLRDGLIDKADNHRELARWCKKNRLSDHERVHWAKVLEFDKQDGEALEALGLQLYEGRLMTRGQIEKARFATGERLKAMRTWQPQLLKLRRAIESGSDNQRQAALDGLKNLDDPAAIPALEAVFAVDGTGDKVIAANRALVETVGRMAVPDATQVLLRRAVLGEPEEARNLAMEQLRRRPMYAYVPQLIASLPGSIKENVQQIGTNSIDHLTLFESLEPRAVLDSTANGARALDLFDLAEVAAKRQIVHAARSEAHVNAVEQRLNSIRERVQNALVLSTGFTGARDAESWERYYNDYHAWYVPVGERAKSNCYALFHRWKKGQSCFPAGTKIVTREGFRPVEAVKIGDYVLAQDTRSGELSYKIVHGVTLRPPIVLKEIALENESILATPGHPFWVIGEGWRMAQHLKPGCPLHTVDGPREVTGVETTRDREAYNLVVSDFHTYFVGDAKVLVHDNAPLEEQPQLVPGLAAAEP